MNVSSCEKEINDLIIPVISGLAAGIVIILIFAIFNINSSHTLFLENVIPSEPRITQKQAIDAAKQELITNYLVNEASFGIMNYSVGKANYVPLETFIARNWTVPLVYVHPNGTTYGIDAKSHLVAKCPSYLPHLHCLEPSDRVKKIIAGRLGWYLDMDLQCKDSRNDFPIAFIIDANNGQVIWRGGTIEGHVKLCT